MEEEDSPGALGDLFSSEEEDEQCEDLVCEDLDSTREGEDPGCGCAPDTV